MAQAQPNPWANLPMPQPSQLAAYFNAPQGQPSPWQAMPFVGPPSPADMPPQSVTDQAAQLAPQPAQSPVPRGTSSMTQRTSSAPPPNAGATQAMLNGLDASQTSGMDDQRQTIAELKQKAAALADKPLPINLQPAAALIDSWTGSHMAPAAAPQETAQTRQEQIQKLQDAVMKGQQGLSQDQVNYMKDKLNAQWHAEDTAARSQDREISRQAVGVQRDAIRGAREDKVDADRFAAASKALTSDEVVKDALKKKDEVTTIRDQLNEAQTNPIANATLPMATVRLFVNRVSAPELAAAGGSKALTDKATQIAKDMADGTITEANAKFMQGLIDSVEKSANANLKNHIERHAKNYLATPGVAAKPLGDVADALSGGLYSNVSGPSADETATALAWAKANPKDPRSAAIVQQFGGK